MAHLSCVVCYVKVTDLLKMSSISDCCVNFCVNPSVKVTYTGTYMNIHMY